MGDLVSRLPIFGDLMSRFRFNDNGQYIIASFAMMYSKFLICIHISQITPQTLILQ